MTSYTYKQIVDNAKKCKANVESDYKIGVSTKWTYYFCQAIINPNKDIAKIDFEKAPQPSGSYISRQVDKDDYIKLAKTFVSFVKTHKRLPNYLAYKSYKIRPALYTYAFARIVVYYNKNGKLPSYVNMNSKAFTKPIETKNTVYNYFCKVLNNNKKVMSVDEALQLIEDRGYSYYYDDKYSNKNAIDRIKAKLGINCTDSCHVIYNVVQQLVELKKYKKVECLHVQCSSGGHVKLRITLNDGSKIIRDPACVLSDNGKGIKCVWCTNTGVSNPKWFMDNLYR